MFKVRNTTKATQFSSWAFMQKFYIGGRENPYIIRWTLVRTPLGSLMVHKMCRSDYERALHDHPWNFVSVVLKGFYWEAVGPGARVMRKRWSVAYRPATWKHRVVLPLARGEFINNPPKHEPCWTLVLCSRRLRSWGFWMPDGTWCWWRKHNPELNICEPEVVYEGGRD